MFKTYGIYAKVQFLYYQKRWLAAFFPNVYNFILQFSILEFPPSSSCSLEKSAKRLQIPRVKNGLLNVGTCNAYIVLFIPSFFVLPRQKCMDSNLRMYSLTKKFFVKKRETEQEAVVLCTIVYIVISRPLGSIVIGSFRTSRK